MSGIYIKGLEMPTDNTVLLRVFPASENGECYTQQLDVDEDVLAEYWAVPVPPHGRLGDLDALIEAYDFVHIGPPGMARTLIAEAPTIIPASGGKENE